MKKTVIFILLVLSVTFVNAQRARKSSNLEKFNLKPIETVVDDLSRSENKNLKIHL